MSRHEKSLKFVKEKKIFYNYNDNLEEILIKLFHWIIDIIKFIAYLIYLWENIFRTFWRIAIVINWKIIDKNFSVFSNLN